MQFCVAIDEFGRFGARERQLSGHTLAAYRADLNDFSKWIAAWTRAESAGTDAPPDVAVADISAATVKDYLEDMVGTRKLAVATGRGRFACLRAFFRRAAARGGVADACAEWRPLLARRKGVPRAVSWRGAKFLPS